MVRPWTNSESFWPLDRDIIMDNDGWWPTTGGAYQMALQSLAKHASRGTARGGHSVVIAMRIC